MSKQVGMVGLAVTVAWVLLAGTSAAQAYIPLSTPAIGFGAELPATDTPSTPSVAVYTPSVTVPGPCNFSFCTDETALPGGTVATPAFESAPVGTPALGMERTCAPSNLACVNGFSMPAQDVANAPAVPSNEVGLPATALPAVCSASAGLCHGSYTFPGTGIVMPASGGEPLLPVVGFWVGAPGVQGSIPIGAPDVGTTDPMPITVPAPVVGDVSLTLCENACPGYAGELPVEVVGPAGFLVSPGDATYGLAPL
jgi:hypothetical protein